MERRRSLDAGAARSDTVRRRGSRGVPWLLAALLCLAEAGPARADSVVLIVSTRSPIHAIDGTQLRRAFMGFPVADDGVELRPARNRSDARLDEIFLQTIVGLSRLVYDRHVLERAMREGNLVPRDFAKQDDLFDEVARDPSVVSYGWAAAVANRPDLRVVRILWHE